MILDVHQGNKVCSDGEETELRMLEIARKYPEDESQNYISGCNEYTINNTFSSVRRNLLNWYDFDQNSSVLEVGAGMGAVTGLLCDKCAKVTALEMSARRAEVIRARYPKRDNLEVIVSSLEGFSAPEQYDYVVVVGVLEYAGVFSTKENPYIDFLKEVQTKLKPGGKLLLAIENQYGAKYWCGASEDHLQEPFAGIQGYRKPNTPRTFSKATLGALLCEAGFEYQRFYSVLPDYKFPTMLFTDEWQPNAMDLHNVAFTYGKNSVLTANEKALCGDLLKNGVFSFFADSFFVEASSEQLKTEHPVLVAAKGENKQEYRTITKISIDGTLTKLAAHKKAEAHLDHIEKNERTLSERGLNVLQSTRTKNGLVRPIVSLQRADNAFVAALNRNDLQTVLSHVEKLREALRKSSPEAEKGQNILFELGLADPSDDFGSVLAEGYFDLTFYNAFLKDEELVFYDQEWCFSNTPLELILYYAVKSIFSRSAAERLIDLNTILKYLKISEAHRKIYDLAESALWERVLYRGGDTYGADGYCTQYHNTPKLQEILEARESEKRDLESTRTELNNKAAHIELLLKSERDLQAALAQKERDYIELQKQDADVYAELERKKDAAYEALEHEKDAAYEALRRETDERVAQLEQTVRNKEGHIDLLLESDRELERIQTSRSWRFMTLLWMIRDFLVPKGSKRRLFGKLIIKFVKHPFRFLSKCTPMRIGKFFTFLRREGTESVSRRLDDCLIGTDIPPTPVELTPVEAPLPGTEKTAADYAPLSVPQWDKPTVSIVIPVYNQFDYTYLCVQSILEHSGDVSYEIIIADDCSTDLTKEIDRVITGLHTLHNSNNLRFLLNCNNAAKSAQGKYILFLNNDTQVQENWLAPLVELIERADDIGMVGSKLVYPDGRLQEAGGILWKDGSAWNYGNRSDPDLPEYNYVKEADYISGAAIMIRRELWEEIGGFDERFVPAYCEDSDLAFEVRRHGYKVMYQPASVVVHFEGVSNGTDTSSGQKAYQVVNQKKFYEKWKDVLESEHFENGENVFQARDRSRNKETILVIDHYIPTYDKDAGSRTVDQYIRLLVDLGFNVKLLGDNFYHNVPYAIRYEQWGVEILYGVYYRDNWKKWVLENRDTLSCVFMNRPHISVKYIDFFKSETDAKIIYYGHDLHYLRERREYELNHDERLLKSSENWKKQELGIMQKADVVFTISCDEKEIINHELGAEKAVISPIFYYNSIPKRKKNLQDCRDIIFVGGFSHHPNEDGILWFVKKVWPTVSKRLPDSKLIVIGSNPTEQIKQIASDRIVVTGYVTDEKLSEYYESSRVCVVPLRYGAGVKGKTVEAMSFQIPIVSTAIGIEGLAGIEQYIQSSDTPNDFAERVVSLYTDTQLAESESKKYCDYLQERFSYESAKTLFKEVFNRKDIGK